MIEAFIMVAFVEFISNLKKKNLHNNEFLSTFLASASINWSRE